MGLWAPTRGSHSPTPPHPPPRRVGGGGVCSFRGPPSLGLRSKTPSRFFGHVPLPSPPQSGNSSIPLRFFCGTPVGSVHQRVDRRGWRFVGCPCPGVLLLDYFGLPIFSFCRANFYVRIPILNSSLFSLPLLHLPNRFSSRKSQYAAQNTPTPPSSKSDGKCAFAPAALHQFFVGWAHHVKIPQLFQ